MYIRKTSKRNTIDYDLIIVKILNREIKPIQNDARICTSNLIAKLRLSWDFDKEHKS